MLFLIDTADIKAIKNCCEYYPVAGVTTNPTIVSKEKTDFKNLIYSIREIIGDDKMLHVQATANEASEILNSVLDQTKLYYKDTLTQIKKNSSFFEEIKECEEIIKFVKPRIDNKNIMFKLLLSSEIPNVLYGDKAVVRDIITNLLNNAIEYTKNGYIKIF